MTVDTHIFPPANAFAGISGVYTKWVLWFVSGDGNHTICHYLVTKPTKRTVRKLRREFRKSNTMTDHERIVIDVLGME